MAHVGLQRQVKKKVFTIPVIRTHWSNTVASLVSEAKVKVTEVLEAVGGSGLPYWFWGISIFLYVG
jgi:hypothetical protein